VTNLGAFTVTSQADLTVIITCTFARMSFSEIC
jgi:hypothetical protein